MRIDVKKLILYISKTKMNKAVVWLINVLYLMFFAISNTAFALNPNVSPKTSKFLTQ